MVWRLVLSNKEIESSLDQIFDAERTSFWSPPGIYEVGKTKESKKNNFTLKHKKWCNKEWFCDVKCCDSTWH